MDQERRAQLCYEQNCLQMRSLNQTMWQVPVIAMTLTGGLWYGVASLDSMDTIIGIVLLVFCGIANLGLVMVIQRVRSVMGAYLEKMEEFYPDGFADATDVRYTTWLPSRGVCNTMSLLMLVAATISWLGAFFFCLL